MRIQEIRFKETADIKLWYRKNGKIENAAEKLIFGQNAVVFTNTYYNSFAIEKWDTYCDFQKIELKIIYFGKFRIKIYQADVVNDKLQEKEIFTDEMNAETEQEYCFMLPQKEKGSIYFSLEAFSEGAYIKQAFYEGLCTKEKDVKIALNFCTFRREKELLKNIERLKEAFLENEKEALNDRLKIFITDNGRTLDREALSEKDIYIHYNENVGGAGGFTRGLAEINRVKEQENITHVIFMDDDIEFEPEALKRTFTMLCALRREYQDAFISGAMLQKDKPYMQCEAGGWWNWKSGKSQPRNGGMNLKKYINVVKNEQIEEVEYAAWWYCCVPITAVNENNLPMPFFIHDDDVEYSLRNTNCIITLNGIAVRHPLIGHKCVSANVYYDIRNALILNSCHYYESYKPVNAKKIVLQAMAGALLKYRYKDMHLVYQAVEDFCKGADWLLHVDAVAYHKEIQKKGYVFEDVSKYVGDRAKEADLYDKGRMPGPLALFRQADSWKKKVQMLLLMGSLNGWLLPAKRETGIFYMNVHPMFLYRKKQAVLFNEDGMQGIVVKKSFRQLFVFIGLLLKTNALLNRKFEVSKNSYKTEFKKLISMEYWKENYHY